MIVFFTEKFDSFPELFLVSQIDVTIKFFF